MTFLAVLTPPSLGPAGLRGTVPMTGEVALGGSCPRECPRKRLLAEGRREGFMSACASEGAVSDVGASPSSGDASGPSHVRSAPGVPLLITLQATVVPVTCFPAFSTNYLGSCPGLRFRMGGST